MLTLSCKKCGKSNNYSRKSSYTRAIKGNHLCNGCSRQKRTENICKNCNSKFEVITSRLKYNYGQFCSNKCRLEYLHNKIIYGKCKVCENEFRTSKSLLAKGCGKFCSIRCKLIGSDKRQKDYTKRKNVNCPNCNKKFNITLSEVCSKWGNFCCKHCYTEWMSNEISKGNINIPYGRHSKRGHYYSIINKTKFYYDSSYELKRMQQLDANGIVWTKKHGIKIKYLDKDGVFRYYIPDFLINNKILEEVKPQKLVNSTYFNNNLKQYAARKYCKNNNLEYRIITEKELKI